MDVITYSLWHNQAQSLQYYNDVAAFVDEVLAQGEARFDALLDAFEAFIRQTGREAPRTPAEYLYELLTLGVLWRVYAADAPGLGDVPRQLLTCLAGLRERNEWLKPGVDRMRGVLSALFLSSGAHRTTAEPTLTLEHLDKLLGWLAATGVYEEAVGRLTNWRDFFAGPSCVPADATLAAALAFAAWFESRSLEALGRYTCNVERFLAGTHPGYRGREDALFCGRRRVEYHLNMVGTEILNRAFREMFLRTRHKAVLVPPCMRFQPEGQCKAQPTGFGAQCAGCTPGCRVHQVTKLGEKHGFAVFILPDEISVFSTRTAKHASPHDLGIVGVSCVLTNAAGGWETRRLGIPAQGLLLDYCGCRYHWHKQGIPTDINLNQLLRVLGIRKADSPSSPA